MATKTNLAGSGIEYLKQQTNNSGASSSGSTAKTYTDSKGNTVATNSSGRVNNGVSPYAGTVVTVSSNDSGAQANKNPLSTQYKTWQAQIIGTNRIGTSSAKLKAGQTITTDNPLSINLNSASNKATQNKTSKFALNTTNKTATQKTYANPLAFNANANAGLSNMINTAFTKETIANNLQSQYDRAVAELNDRTTKAGYDTTGSLPTDYISSQEKKVRELNEKLQTAKEEAKAEKYNKVLSDPNYTQNIVKGRLIYNADINALNGQDPGNKIRWADEHKDEIALATNAKTHLDSDAADYNAYTYASTDERGIYFSLLATEGKKAADDYLEYMLPTWKARAGKSISDSVDSQTGVNKVLSQVNLAAKSAGDSTVAGIEQNFAQDAIPYSTMEYANMASKENQSKIMKIVTGAVEGLVSTVPAIGVSMIPGAGNIMEGLQERGSLYRELINEGYDPNSADKAATVAGVATGLTSYFLSGINAIGGKATKWAKGKIDSKLAENIENAAVRASTTAAAKFGASELSEISEEILQNKVEDIARNLALGENNDLSFNEEDLETAFITAITTAITNGGTYVAGKAIDNVSEKATIDRARVNKTDEYEEIMRPQKTHEEAVETTLSEGGKNTQVEMPEQTQEVKPAEIKTENVTDELGEPPLDKTAEKEPPKGYENVLDKVKNEREAEVAKREKAKKEKDNQPKPKTKEEKTIASQAERITELQAQNKETKAKTVRKADVKKAAKVLAEENGTSLSQAEIGRQLQEIGDYIVSHDGDTMDPNEVSSKAKSLAEDILDNVYEEDLDAEEKAILRKDILTTFKGKKINLNGFEHDVSEDFKEWASHYRGVFSFTKDGGIDISTEFPELAIRYPDIFNESQANTVGEMMSQIADAYDYSKTDSRLSLEERLGRKNYDAHKQELANSIIDLVIGEDIRETGPNRIDKLTAQVRDLKAKLAEQKTTDKQKFDAYKQKVKAEKVSAKEVKTRKNLLASISKSAKDISAKLKANTKKKNVKDGMKDLANALLNISDGVLSKDQETQIDIGESLGKLIDTYDATQKSNDSFIKDAYDQDISDLLSGIKEDLSGKTLADLTNDDLTELAAAYKAVAYTINRAGKLFSKGKNATIESTAKSVQDELAKQKPKNTNPLLNGKVSWVDKFGWQNLKPIAIFDVIGSKTMSKLFGSVMDAEDVSAKDAKEAHDFYQEEYRKYNVGKWNFDKVYKFDGAEMRLGNILSLYAYSRRAQAMGHITNGGITIEAFKDSKGKEHDKSALIKLDEDDVNTITDKLTPEQKSFVEDLQKYLSTDMAKKGNEVSQEMYGIDLFNEENAWHIKIDNDYAGNRNTSDSTSNKNAEIKNSGFTRETSKGANNPIVIGDFISDFGKQVNDMAMYHAFVLPLENFKKVFNYASSDTSVSTKKALQQTFGDNINGAIKKLMDDVNGGVKLDRTGGISDKILSLFKQNAVAMNMSVIVQQGTSVIRGMAYIDPKYWGFVKLSPEKVNSTWKEMNENAGVTILKDMGYFDTNMGRSVGDYITEAPLDTVKDKVYSFRHDSETRSKAYSYFPSEVDKVAWVTMWDAVKRETEAATDLKPGSKEFLEYAGKRFTDVCKRTQVYDSTLSRSELMRSQNGATKMATAFMAEPTTMTSMLATAEAESRRGNKSLLKKTSAAVLGSVLLNDIISSFVYAMRDDDEDKSYWEKYAKAFGDQLRSDVLFGLPNSMPYIKDIFSIFEGNRVERADASYIRTIWNTAQEILDEDTAWGDKALSLLELAGYATKTPFKNLRRDVEGMVNTITNDRKTTLVGVTDAFTRGLLGRDDPNAEKTNNRIQNAYRKGQYNLGKDLMYEYWAAPVSLTDPKTGESTELTEEEQETYVTNKQKYADQFYNDLINDPLFKNMSKEEQDVAFSKVESQVTTMCERDLWLSRGEKGKEVNTDKLSHWAALCAISGDNDVQISDMRSLCSGNSNTPALDEDNVKDYFAVRNEIKSAIDDEDYSRIDTFVNGFDKLDKNIKDVLVDKVDDLNKLVNVADSGVNAEQYYSYKGQLDTAADELNCTTTNSKAKLLALARSDIEGDTLDKVIQDNAFGLSATSLALVEVLCSNDYSFEAYSLEDVAKFLDHADYTINEKYADNDLVDMGLGSTNKSTRTLAKQISTGQVEANEESYEALRSALIAEGTALDGVDGGKADGTLRNLEVAQYLVDSENDQKLTAEQATEIYEALKEKLSNYYNDWGDYTYLSEKNYLPKAEAKGWTYGKGKTMAKSDSTSSSKSSGYKRSYSTNPLTKVSTAKWTAKTIAHKKKTKKKSTNPLAIKLKTLDDLT